jgi:hypothetical protein
MDLALSVRPIEMHPEDPFVLVIRGINVSSHTFPARSCAHGENGYAIHQAEQVERDFKQLVADHVGLPYCTQHKHVLVPGQVFHGVLN